MAYGDDKKQDYLDALANCGVKTRACTIAGVSYTVVQKWLAEDAEFAEAYGVAMEQAADSLESEARRRAVEGVERTKYTKDGTAYIETSYSDTLLIFLLNGAKPDKYAYRTKQELTGAGGKPLADMGETTAAARLAAILDAARQRVRITETTITEVDPLS